MKTKKITRTFEGLKFEYIPSSGLWMYTVTPYRCLYVYKLGKNACFGFEQTIDRKGSFIDGSKKIHTFNKVEGSTLAETVRRLITVYYYDEESGISYTTRSV